MKLFADVYPDEDVSVLIAKLLQARGFKAVTARDEEMLGQDDPDQLVQAVSLGRSIVTHNRYISSIYMARIWQAVRSTLASSSPPAAALTK